MADLRAFHGPNAAYVLDLYEQYARDPQSVDAEWRDYFAQFSPGEVEAAPAAAATSTAPAAAAPAVDVAKLVNAREMSRTIRTRGLTGARLDPLGSPPDRDPALALDAYGLTEADLEQLPAAVVLGHDPASPNLAAEVRRLNGIYSGTLGYDYHHIPIARERSWLREAIESGRFTGPLPAERRRELLRRLSQVEGFERFLHRAFFGQKRFSIEGTDTLVPILDEVVREAAHAGAADVIVGMAHRGRLNVLTHVLGKPYPLMLTGFQSAQAHPDREQQNTDEPSGDVKYHMGWETETEVDGHSIRVTLSPNPSHLEFVDPVVVGMTRASQDDTTVHPGAPGLDFDKAFAVMIHGDAAFPGQGVVAETLNMSGLRGYCVGGTLHLIANNQVGFTTDPVDDRSTRYASDLARGFEIPVVHVNADDPEACLAAARLAFAYRQAFRKDFVIDLVGYRRWGHNEGDEPSFTQPAMYEVIKNHPTVRELYAKRLAEEGVVAAADAEAMAKAVADELAQALEAVASGAAAAHPEDEDEPEREGRRLDPQHTAVPADRLRELNEALLQRPEGFTPNARLEKNVLEKRREALASDRPAIDWGQAEALAFASLLAEGVPVRLTGQDAERGTFSHRHAVLSDAKTGAKHNPFHHLPQAQASFEIYNSPLSEMAVVGFEYGYSVYDPQALVLWEAQFGDFANGAQVIIDQFLVCSESKWRRASGLVMLLPHGYEGQGPEHSSGRLERFLQLAAEDNIQVCNLTTPAQYFHVLRRQAALLGPKARPLVLMTPKSLLRHPLAGATLADLAEGGFHPVLVD
ncbi:MAG: 2-oxoglutarate dehydrogenase E1 component, partial [Longimicrobiaceae bacterium]